jgi:hypothetical protein
MAQFNTTDNIRWKVENGILSIEPGSDGEMIDYVKDNVCSSPWYSYRDSIVKAEIGKGITRIGAGAFYDCFKLAMVDIPDTVVSVGGQAFHNCGNLKKLVFPKALESIGDYAFTFCVSLNKIEFKSEKPPSVGKSLFTTVPGNTTMVTLTGSSIDSEVFAERTIGANGLVTFEAEGKDDNIWWSLSNGTLNIMIAKNKTDEYKPYVKDNVCSSPWHKYRTGIHKVAFSDKFKQINDGMFFDCIYLDDVVMPQSVEVIGRQAFHNCRAIKTLTIPRKVVKICDFAFTFCVSLETVYMLPENKVELGYHLFDTVPDAKMITLKGSKWMDSSVINSNTIGNNAKVTYETFGNLENMEWRIKNGVLTISPIPGMSTVMEDLVSDNVCKAPWHDYVYGIYKISVEGNIENIGAGAFYDCFNATSIDMPSSITSIGFQAFHNCRSLRHITIPSKVSSLGDYEFTFCTSLRTIFFMSENAPRFGIGMFDGCPDNVEIKVYTMGWKPRREDKPPYEMVKFFKLGE